MKKYILLVSFICLTLSAEVVQYNLSECIDIALKKNVSVINAIDNLEIANTKIVQARSAALPQLSASGSYTRLEDKPEIDNLDNYQVNLSANQLLFSGGQVATALKAAKESKKYYGYGFEGVASEITRDVVKGFYGVLFTESVAMVREESLKQLVDLLEDSEVRLKTGTASEFDVLRAKVSVSNEKPLLIVASNNYNIAVASFKRLLNLDGQQFVLTGSLSNYPSIKENLNLLDSMCLLNRPDILEMESLMTLREYDKDSASSDWWPDVSLNFNYRGENDSDSGFFGDEWGWGWNAGVVAKWDIWNGNLTYGLVKEKTIELRKQENTYEDFRKTALLQVKVSYLDMNAATRAIDAALDGVGLAVQAQNIASQRYQIGLGTYLEFTDSNLSLSTSRLTLLTAVYEYYRAIADLEYAVGLELFEK
jgi:outer membrane protein TolC